MFNKKITIFFLSLYFLQSSFVATAGGDDKKGKDWVFHPSFETGLLLGGRINNENFVYESGYFAYLIADVQVSKKVYYGLGSGFNMLEDKTFIPVFVDFKGSFESFNKSSSYFSCQLGYSIASYNDDFEYENVNYKGGIMFSPGFGYRFNIRDSYCLLINISYQHQFGEIEYSASGGRKISEGMDFDLLFFKLGFMF